MKKVSMLLAVMFLLSGVVSKNSIAQNSGKNSAIYGQIAGRYTVEMGARLLPVCIVYKPDTGKLFFEAVAFRPEEMIPIAGSFSINELGLCDMSGNVWEWCGDWYQKGYEGREIKNPPYTHWYKVIRGGSWNTGPKSIRSAVQGAYPPDTRANDIGFRGCTVNSIITIFFRLMLQNGRDSGKPECSAAFLF